jgi:hypothetical protein
MVQHPQPVPGGVARKVDQHVGLVGCDLIGRRLVTQLIEPPPKIGPVTKLAGHFIGWSTGFVGVDPNLIRRPLPPNRGQQAADRMPAKIA